MCPVDAGSFCTANRVLWRFLQRTLRDGVPALCGNTCALAGACLVNVLLRILLIGKVIFAYRRHGWFSSKLRDVTLEIKSRWYLVKKLNIAKRSFAPILNAAGFCCVVLVHCRSSAGFQCCEGEHGCYTGNPSNDLGFSSKWEVPCA